MIVLPLFPALGALMVLIGALVALAGAFLYFASLDSYQQSWRKYEQDLHEWRLSHGPLTGDFWKRLLTAEGRTDLLPLLDSKVRLAISADVRRPGSPPSSLRLTKSGGLPDIGPSFTWPCDSEGRPMKFLAQVGLAELPSVEPFAQRESVLQFFYACQDAWPEASEPAMQGVVLMQECTPELRPFGGADMDPLFESVPAGFRVYEDLPEIEQEAVGTARRLLRMGQDFQLLGYPHGNGAPAAEDWTLLFQAHNPDEFRDGGVDVFYFIRPDDLAALRFSSVRCQGRYAV